jgi:hypothetical protein
MTRDLRGYAKKTNIQLAFGAFILLFVIGIGLIWLVYGFGAAVSGLLCMLAALIPIGLIFLSLQIIDWINKRANRD